MKLHFYIFLSVFTFLFVFLGCSNDKVIDEDKFVKVYTDLVMAQDTLQISEANFDSVKQSVFNRHRITSGQYEYTVNYYNEDVKRWERFFNKATAYIDTLRSSSNSARRK